MICGPFVPERDLLDDGLDARAVVVALAVDLLGPRQQRLDAPELDERVAVVGLLDDARDQLADAVAVLLVHHVPLGLADALQDDLLGGLRGDPAEVLRRDVGAHHQVLGNLRPVELEVGVVDGRVLTLAGLLLDRSSSSIAASRASSTSRSSSSAGI